MVNADLLMNNVSEPNPFQDNLDMLRLSAEHSRRKIKADGKEIKPTVEGKYLLGLERELVSPTLTWKDGDFFSLYAEFIFQLAKLSTPKGDGYGTIQSLISSAKQLVDQSKPADERAVVPVRNKAGKISLVPLDTFLKAYPKVLSPLPEQVEDVLKEGVGLEKSRIYVSGALPDEPIFSTSSSLDDLCEHLRNNRNAKNSLKNQLLEAAHNFPYHNFPYLSHEALKDIRAALNHCVVGWLDNFAFFKELGGEIIAGLGSFDLPGEGLSQKINYHFEQDCYFITITLDRYDPSSEKLKWVDFGALAIINGFPVIINVDINTTLGVNDNLALRRFNRRNEGFKLLNSYLREKGHNFVDTEDSKPGLLYIMPGEDALQEIKDLKDIGATQLNLPVTYERLREKINEAKMESEKRGLNVRYAQEHGIRAAA